VAAGDQGPLLFGQLAGRIQPTGWTAPDGSWAILIGSEDPDKDADIEIGDTGGFEQSIDLTATKLLTWAMKFRNSADAAMVDFKVSLKIDGLEFWSEQIAASAMRDYVQRTVNVTNMTGATVVALVLEAVDP
jgi:hypothetical protein